VAAEGSAGAAPAAALTLFGSRLSLAQAYAQLLATDGIGHGLIGPRELERIWERHLLNSAVISELIPSTCRVVDIGSGAGLPGLALACARPDLHLQLVEPMQRRVDFLSAAVSTLGLDDQVEVVRGRADDRSVVAQVGRAQWVTARAVAPLDRLVRWCLPLLASGGSLLALKGAQAEREIESFSPGLPRSVSRPVELIQCGVGILEEPARVIRIRRT
jgi:16S rRNA (guanine527-N7)-methyltransferase